MCIIPYDSNDKESAKLKYNNIISIVYEQYALLKILRNGKRTN